MNGMQFGRGQYRTHGGYRAIVAQLKKVGMGWELRGAIECPVTLELSISKWHLDGKSFIDPVFDLSHDIFDEAN